MKRMIFFALLFLHSINFMSIAGVRYYIDDGSSHLFDNAIYHADWFWIDSLIANVPSTHIDIIDGGQVYSFFAHNNATITMSGGSVHTMDAYDSSTITILDGLSYGIRSYNNSNVTVLGGEVGGYFYALDNSFINISGGSINGELRAYYNGIIYLVGSGFEVDGQALSYGDRLSDFGTYYENINYGYGYHYGTITGTLSDGSALNSLFKIYSTGIWGGTCDIIIIPEPTTLSLLALGAMLARRRRKES